MQVNAKPKICFVALQAYPVLSKAGYKSAGGAEVQQVLLAKELKNNGFDVSFIVADYGQNDLEIIDDIKAFKVKSSFISGIISLIKAMNLVNADLYYQRAAGYITGIIALYCILKRKKCIYSISSETDVDGTHIKETYIKHLPSLIRSFYKCLYKFGIQNADCIIAQNENQKKLLKKTFKRDSIVIKNGHFLPDERPKKDMPPIVLWVSAINNWKQPELFLKLAEAIPTAKFQMIGGPSGDKKFYEKIEDLANKIQNLDFVGFVPFHEINQYFDRASILINTSPKEGFPNTFIQAWARYVPTVTLNADPDGVICRYRLGFHSRTCEKLVSDVKLLLGDEVLLDELGMNARRYAEKEHDIKKIVAEYEKVFSKLITSKLR
jgi:glycosyltransferase involved in cell wall biosynthesis